MRLPEKGFLVGHWAEIAERRVPPLPIVPHLNEVTQVPQAAASLESVVGLRHSGWCFSGWRRTAPSGRAVHRSKSGRGRDLSNRSAWRLSVSNHGFYRTMGEGLSEHHLVITVREEVLDGCLKRESTLRVE